MKTIIKNKNNTEKNKGYAENYGTLKEKENKQDSTKNEILSKFKINRWINKTIEICKNKNIPLILFTSPYFQNRNFNNFENFKKYNIAYFNLSSTITEEQYFSDKTHLNHKGAIKFTKIISKEFSLVANSSITQYFY